MTSCDLTVRRGPGSLRVRWRAGPRGSSPGSPPLLRPRGSAVPPAPRASLLGREAVTGETKVSASPGPARAGLWGLHRALCSQAGARLSCPHSACPRAPRGCPGPGAAPACAGGQAAVPVPSPCAHLPEGTAPCHRPQRPRRRDRLPEHLGVSACGVSSGGSGKALLRAPKSGVGRPSSSACCSSTHRAREAWCPP